MASADPKLRLYNTLTRQKDDFTPFDPGHVRMYVCGPTVYDYAHIGNARPVIVFDVLYRLLRHLYGDEHVTYVRNITDVDDKIMDRARERGIDIRELTEETNRQFQADMSALGCLEPDQQPRATETIDEMIAMIRILIDRKHAYVAEGEVLFDVASMPDYGRLSNRDLDEQRAGARVEVDRHKRNPGDFVLWKLSDPDQPGWDSPWGRGRPGWHIECSAMSDKWLWEAVKDDLSQAGRAHPHQFDIHGGGIDLIFPHHENEIAQSRCAHGTPAMAQVWMHNGYLQVEGQKMSKSLGNFITVQELYRSLKFGGRAWDGAVIRMAMLKVHYRQPIDWTVRLLEEADRNFWSLVETRYKFAATEPDVEVVAALCDDLNTKAAIDQILQLQRAAEDGNTDAGGRLVASLNLLGFLEDEVVRTGLYWEVRNDGSAKFDQEQLPAQILKFVPQNAPFHVALTRLERANDTDGKRAIPAEVLAAIRSFGQFAAASASIGDVFLSPSRSMAANNGVQHRLTALANKDFATADRIRAELLEQGIQLMDYKDPETGERRTKWEVKR